LSPRTADRALCGGGSSLGPDGGRGGTGGVGGGYPGAGGASGAAGASWGGYGGTGAAGGYAGTGGYSGKSGQAGTAGAAGTGGASAADGSAGAPQPDAEPADAGCALDGDADATCGTPSEAGKPIPPPAPNPPLTPAPGLCEGVDLESPLKLYLSADDSNSMASPAIVRSLVRQGHGFVNPWIVRTYEFLNYYRFGFQPAPAGQLSIVSQIGSCELAGDIALQIAVQSEATGGIRREMNLTLVLDTSGSMGGNPIALERAAVKALASSLRAGDVVSAVTWNDHQIPVLKGHVVSGPDDPAIVAMANAMEANGSTNLAAGLALGYSLAEQYRAPGRINRVVLISDGQANTGITDEKLIGGKAEDQDAEGIYLVGVGVGNGVNDTLMDTVTDLGRGAYIFLDSEAEARRMFVDRFSESILVAARDVRIELTLPAYFNMKKFYGEAYSPDPAKIRPQHLAPDDSMMLLQIIHPCDPALPRANDPYRVRVTWKDPVTGEPKVATQQTTLGQLDIDDGNLTKAAKVVEYAETLKALQALSATERKNLLNQTRKNVMAANPSASDPDLTEIQSLLEKLIQNNGGTVN
jgi:Ca-activated chloride channel family protein